MKTVKVFITSVFLFAAISFAQNDSTIVEPKKAGPHSISIEYGIGTLTDLAWAFAVSFLDAFSPDEEEPEMFMMGAVSVNYGYQINELFETGLSFNFAMPEANLPFFSLMPRLKLNFNKDGWINPYTEADFGIATLDLDFAPIFHFTLLGFELWQRCYLQLLGIGQRGMFYTGLRFQL